MRRKGKTIRKVTIDNTLFDYEEYGKKLYKIMSRVDEGMDRNSNRLDMGDSSDKKTIRMMEEYHFLSFLEGLQRDDDDSSSGEIEEEDEDIQQHKNYFTYKDAGNAEDADLRMVEKNEFEKIGVYHDDLALLCLRKAIYQVFK